MVSWETSQDRRFSLSSFILTFFLSIIRIIIVFLFLFCFVSFCLSIAIFERRRLFLSLSLSLSVCSFFVLVLHFAHAILHDHHRQRDTNTMLRNTYNVLSSCLLFTSSKRVKETVHNSSSKKLKLIARVSNTLYVQERGKNVEKGA